MTRHFGGDSGDLAEIIIDYNKKKVKILDINTNKPFPKLTFRSLFYWGTLSVFVWVFFLFSWLILGNLIFNLDLSGKISGILFIFGCVISWFFTFNNSLSNKLHYITQFISNDLLSENKVVIINKLNSKIYKLPFEFKNNKLDYKCWGDFKKYLIKVHIFPKDYYIKYGKELIRQDKEWHAWFYFTKIPREGKGKMEVTFI